MKNKTWIAIITQEDIERRYVRCFDGSYVDVSPFCGYLSNFDLGRFVYKTAFGELEVESHIERKKRQLRLKSSREDTK